MDWLFISEQAFTKHFAHSRKANAFHKVVLLRNGYLVDRFCRKYSDEQSAR